MKKFFVLFCIPGASIDEWMKTTDEATRKRETDEMMEGWNTWMSEHEKSIVDKGLPIGKTKRVTANGIADARNDLIWYLIVEAESPEAAAEMLKNHPHLQIPSAYIDVSGASAPGM